MALLARKEETVIAASNFILLPLTFLSSAFMQRDLVPGWIQSVARYTRSSGRSRRGREALTATPTGAWSLSVGPLVALTVACTWLANSRLPQLPAGDLRSRPAVPPPRGEQTPMGGRSPSRGVAPGAVEAGLHSPSRPLYPGE